MFSLSMLDGCRRFPGYFLGGFGRDRGWLRKTATMSWRLQEVVTGSSFSRSAVGIYPSPGYSPPPVHYSTTAKEGMAEEVDEFSHLSTSPIHSRKGRSDHYFPKRDKMRRASTIDELKREMVIRSYMSRGHRAALIDPLYIVRKPVFRPEFPSRTVLRQRRIPVDRDIRYLLPNQSRLGNGYYRIKLGELVKRLNAAYCNTVGVEFIYIPDQKIRQWIIDRIEMTDLRFIHEGQKIYCAKKLIVISEVANFLETNSGYTQRYNIEGSETSPLGILLLVQRAAKKYGARVFVLGMRRLARFSLLSSLGLSNAQIFQLMQSVMSETVEKHCLGCIFEAPSAFIEDTVLKFILVASPSVPESFYPIVLGTARGIQDKELDVTADKVWPIVIHMAKGLNAQGIVYESLKLSTLPEYNTGGVIHLVFNNQMEATLKRDVSMKSQYCTDVLKSLNAPIFHVNGDDVTAVHFVCRMAADFRATFKKDVIIDIVSYQRSMASRTQIKYDLVTVQEKINQTQPIVPAFLKNLQKDNIISKTDIDYWKSQVSHILSRDWHEVQKNRLKLPVDMDKWTAQLYLDRIKKIEKERTYDFDTGVKKETLMQISEKLVERPLNFKICPMQEKILENRANLLKNNSLNWVMCEALAYGSLLLDLKNIRLSGMDINRRCQVLQEDKFDGQTYSPLSNLSDTQGKYKICKSTTSQYATAGFEYGYSTVELDSLVVWEAPEGDKTSKAQVIIDHFIAGGFVKYNYHSNIVIFVPHYVDCEKPNSCNGRPERFLQLVNNFEEQTEPNSDKQLQETNMIVAMVSTPGNLFHILRRQMSLPVRRPLVLFIPDILTDPVSSTFDEISTGTRFEPYIPDRGVNPLEVKKVLFCAGNIYHDLSLERARLGLQREVAIARVEQLSPLPYKLVIEDAKRFLNPEMAWVQEEPINQGCFSYIEPRLLKLPNITSLECIARAARADGGTHSVKACIKERKDIFNKAFKLS